MNKTVDTPELPKSTETLEPIVPKSRSLAEWITLGITTVVLTLLIGLIVYDWQVNQNRPPAFQVDVAATIQAIDGRYYVPFSVTNTGGRIVQTVQVVAELHIKGEPDETGEQQIDFLSGSEQKHGSFVFTHDPYSGDLVIRVASYQLP